MAHTSLNLNARVAKSTIYYCEHYISAHYDRWIDKNIPIYMNCVGINQDIIKGIIEKK